MEEHEARLAEITDCEDYAWRGLQTEHRGEELSDDVILFEKLINNTLAKCKYVMEKNKHKIVKLSRNRREGYFCGVTDGRVVRVPVEHSTVFSFRTPGCVKNRKQLKMHKRWLKDAGLTTS